MRKVLSAAGSRASVDRGCCRDGGCDGSRGGSRRNGRGGGSGGSDGSGGRSDAGVRVGIVLVPVVEVMPSWR